MRREIKKGDIEFQMFNDVWAFRKEWHDGEDRDEYWEAMVNAGMELRDKYKGTEVQTFIEMLINSCISDSTNRTYGIKYGEGIRCQRMNGA